MQKIIPVAVILLLLAGVIFWSQMNKEQEDVLKVSDIEISKEQEIEVVAPEIIETEPQDTIVPLVKDIALDREEKQIIEVETQPVIEEEPQEITEEVPSPLPITTWWKPKAGLSWQWQLSGTLNNEYDVDVYDIDLSDTSAAQIASLHAQGRKVICYFSAGSYENWRDDADNFPASVLGKKLDGWAGEKWLDIASYSEFADIMTARLDVAVQKGCDGVESDNIDGYQNNTGFSISATDQIVYNIWLAEEAHARGLAIGLKNDIDQISTLVPFFDFAVNEQCYEYDECTALNLFITADKPVFGVEYELSTSKFCTKANKAGFSFLKMDWDLDGTRISCLYSV